MAIVERDSGWTLRCSGCGAGIELTQKDMRDPEAKFSVKESMAIAHNECDTFKSPEQGKERAEIEEIGNAEQVCWGIQLINWAAVAAVAAMVSALATLVIGAFVHGRLTEKVVTNTEAIKVHEERLDGHDEKLVAHAVDLGKLHEWKDGFNAGSRLTGSQKS